MVVLRAGGRAVASPGILSSLLLLSFPGLWLPGLLRAEDGAAIESVVVTAHRVPRSEADVGSSVTLIDRREIDRRQIVLGSDLLQDVAGLAVSRLGGAGQQTQVRLRGAEANHVLVLIDGIKANDPAGTDEFDFSSLTAWDIASIEVVRGPQSALWGSEATAGVINITTRTEEDGWSAAGFLEGGSRDTVYTGGRLAVGGERAGLALNGSWLETRGESAALSGEENDGLDNLTLGLTARWEPTSAIRLDVGARHTEADVEFDGIDFTTGLAADADLVSRNRLAALKAGGGVSLLDGRWDHSLRATYLDSEREQFRDGAWESSTAAEKVGVYYQSSMSIEPARQQLIFAVDWEDEKYRQRGFVFFNDPNQNQHRDKLGLVAEYLASPIGGLNLSAGVRRDDNSHFDDITTYRLTGSYAIARQLRLRASHGTGQKAPTFTELYGFFPDAFVGNPALMPERTRGFDVGVTGSLLDGRWQGSLGYFRERLEDEIVTTFDPATFLGTAENLDGTSERLGVEAELNGRLMVGLDLRLAYTFTDSKQPDGSREIRRPRHMAAANLDYTPASGRVGINLNLSYTGSQLDQVFPPPTFLPETVKLSDYVLVNLAGRFSLGGNVELYVRAENLFDEDYVNVVGYRAPGRSIHAGIRVSTGSG